MKVAGAGVALTVLITALSWAVWGSSAVVASGVFGLVATIVQTVAVLIVRPVWAASFDRFAARWLVGIGLRLLGVVTIVVAVLLWRDVFPPLPTAFAYLGVLIPLLFTETRFLGDPRDS